MNSLIIGLAGPRGCGKTSAAVYLQQACGAVPLAFADPIREAARALFPNWDPAIHFQSAEKDRLCAHYQVRPRDVLRALGEHARAMGGPLVYVHWMADRIAALEPVGRCRVVIHDVRFTHEAQWVRSQPRGVVVHVQRPGCIWSGEHVSEEGPGESEEDLRLQNPADLAVLRVQTRALWAVLRERMGWA